MNYAQKSNPVFYRGIPQLRPQQLQAQPESIRKAECIYNEDVTDNQVFRALAKKSTEKVRQWFKDQLEESDSD